MAKPRALAFWPVILGLLALDCATKNLAVENLSPANVPHPVVGEIVRFTLAYNKDAAMGLSAGEHSRIVFSVIAIIMLCLLAIYYQRLPKEGRLLPLAVALIAGGAGGNLIDRLRSPLGVVDFIDVGIGDARFWIFNLADAGVVCGAFLLLLVLVREDRGTRAHNEASS
jgi:signal peptidase II